MQKTDAYSRFIFQSIPVLRYVLRDMHKGLLCQGRYIWIWINSQQIRYAVDGIVQCCLLMACPRCPRLELSLEALIQKARTATVQHYSKTVNTYGIFVLEPETTVDHRVIKTDVEN